MPFTFVGIAAVRSSKCNVRKKGDKEEGEKETEWEGETFTYKERSERANGAED